MVGSKSSQLQGHEHKMSYNFGSTWATALSNGIIESLFDLNDDSDVGCVVVISTEVIGGLGSLVVLQPKWMQCLRILFCLYLLN